MCSRIFTCVIISFKISTYFNTFTYFNTADYNREYNVVLIISLIHDPLPLRNLLAIPNMLRYQRLFLPFSTWLVNRRDASFVLTCSTIRLAITPSALR